MPFKAIQGHRGQYQSKARITTSYYWLILPDILSHTVSKLSQTIIQILRHFYIFEPPYGGDSEAVYTVHLRLIGKRVLVVNSLWMLIELFLLDATAEALRGNINYK